MVDRTLEPSRFQTMFPGKADPNEFLTPFDPGAAGIGTLWASAVGQKAVREAAKSAADSAQFIHGAVHGQIPQYVYDEEAGGMVPNPAWSAGAMETALNVAAPSFTRSVLGTKGVADPTTLGIFASTGAKTANTEALDIAKTLFLEGKTRDEIRAATGWFPGADGVWRFEIPDTGFKVNTKSFTPEQLKEGVPLKDVIDHPEFLKAYPEAGDIKYRELKPGEGYLDRSMGGYFHSPSNEIVFSTKGNRGDKAKERVGLHEMQHWVQEKEGMSPGSNPKTETNYRSALVENALQREKEARASEGILTRLKNKLTGKGEPTEKEMKEWVGKDTYMSAHGETESRNVERRFLTNDYKTEPWKTIDRPAEFVIVDEEKAYRDLVRKQNQKQAAESGERNPWANVGWEDDVGGNTFGYANGGLVTNPLDRYLGALGQIESGNNYSALGPRTESGNRAYGRYQVMDFNVPVWTKEVLGTPLTPQQFLENKEAQDAVARAKFGEYVEKTGNPFDAASMWFSGRPMAQAGDSADVTGTNVPEYVSRFANALGMPMEQDASGIAAIDKELLALQRERMSMDQGPDKRQRQRMISALTDFYESTLPQKADFSLLRPMGRKG